MDTTTHTHPLLLDGWYSLAQLARVAETGEDSLATSDESESVRLDRAVLARALRAFLTRSVDLAEAFGVYSSPGNAASPHRVRVEGDRVTGVKFAEEV